jgi:2-polyprenyl-3-methyl-5-hydroxy-6-metoxy-1,4-benzoquinol methylase
MARAATGPAGSRANASADPVLAALRPALAEAGQPAVLDCGGGSGSFAVPLAQAGARVTVVDISIDALATLTRRAADAGIAERVTAVQGDVEQLGDAVGDAQFDLVLAHGVLEAVDSPAGALEQIAAAVRAGGLLSILVSNPAAAVLSRALAGDLAGAIDELDGAATRIDPAAVVELCDAANLRVEERTGIGIFAELVPGSAVDRAGGRQDLAELERRCADRPPFAEIAARVHLLARRGPAPGG